MLKYSVKYKHATQQSCLIDHLSDYFYYKIAVQPEHFNKVLKVVPVIL